MKPISDLKILILDEAKLDYKKAGNKQVFSVTGMTGQNRLTGLFFSVRERFSR